tara:strand:- start:1796 stop:2323 length:528 start_codon:yes stop_codon:yes gene_type:complete
MPTKSSSKTQKSKKVVSKVTKKKVVATAKKHSGVKKNASKKKTKAKAKTKSSSKKVVKKVVKKERKVRSFKVQLPNSETYEGRFTGLTPYQAANKALSKYYRETKKSKKNVRFSIRESTRGSKRLVYHYNGHREKLKVPVEYVIKSNGENRVITKNFKNRLTKIKKAELKALNLA